MKSKSITRLSLAFAAGAALLGAPAHSRAQTLTTSWTNTFDTDTGNVNSTASWCWWYDLEQTIYGYGYNASITNAFDPSVNSTNPPPPTSAPGSGSLHWLLPWPGVPAGKQTNNNYAGQDLIYGTFGGGNQYDNSQTIDASKYDSLSFDIYVNPSSPLDSAGNVCSLTVLFWLTNYNTFTIGNVTIPTNNLGKWVRYTVPINKATAPAPPSPLAGGPGFNINCYGGENSSLFTNTTPTEIWIDNLYLKLSSAASPPPTMLAPTKNIISGLNVFAENCPSDEYQRNEIELIQDTGVGWIGFPGITYSFTIKEFPATNYDSFQAHLFITSDGGVDTAPSLDYNDTNVVWLNVQENADGSGTGYLRYKVNEPASNAGMFGADNGQAGTIIVLPAATPLGTWGLTFNNDTNVTVFGPGGVSASTNLLNFTNFPVPLNIALGAQPNNTNASYNGQGVVYSDFTITNSAMGIGVVYDNFLADSTLDTTTWRTLENEANTVYVFPNDPAQVLVQWYQPDVGYGLQTAGSLNPPANWVTLTGPDAGNSPPPVAPTIFNITPGIRSVLVPGADLLNTNSSFFRLIGQSFIQLQVLMPGETNAPGTVTGKTGSPDPESMAMGGFNVTVNACDADWTVLTGVTDTIHITSSDTTATLPFDGPLAGGTGQFLVSFGQTGTFTVTASDVNAPTIKPGVSSPTVSTP